MNITVKPLTLGGSTVTPPVILGETNETPINVVGQSSGGSSQNVQSTQASQSQNDNNSVFGNNSNLQIQQSYEPINYDLRLIFDLPDRVIRTDTVQEFSIPNGAFIHTNSDEKLSYEATRPDGTALPTWIQFNADKGDFVIDPPEGVYQTMDILVTAKDGKGNKASSSFTIILLDDGPASGPVEEGENVEVDGENVLPEDVDNGEVDSEGNPEGDAELDDEQIQAILEMQEFLQEGNDFVPFSLQLQQNLRTDIDIYASELLRDLYNS